MEHERHAIMELQGGNYRGRVRHTRRASDKFRWETLHKRCGRRVIRYWTNTDADRDTDSNGDRDTDDHSNFDEHTDTNGDADADAD